MNPLSYLKLGGGIFGLIALASLAWLAKDRFHQKGLADAAEDCAVVAFKLTGDLDGCLPEVKSAIEARRQAEACDTALAAERALPSTGLYGIRAACSSEVKTLHAEREAGATSIDDLSRQLREEKARGLDAVARAESRAITSNERIGNAQKAIQAAPLRPDGIRRCDAACLRAIAEQ